MNFYERTAASGMVLCNGFTYGTVVASANEVELYSDWTEMTEAEAEILIAQNSEEEISDEELGAMVREVL